MKKERMAILKMVNDGKITVDEAVKLMETIKGTKSVDPGDMIESVREKVCEIVEDAKPVVKKYAGKAKEMGEDVYYKGKTKVQEYRAKAKNSDFVDEVIIDPAEDIIDEVKEAAGDVKESVKSTIEDTKDAAADIKDSVKSTIEDTKDAAADVKNTVKDTVNDVKDELSSDSKDSE